MPSLKRDHAMLTIWGRRSSFNVQKVLWLDGELGLSYEHVLAGGQHGLCLLYTSPHPIGQLALRQRTLALQAGNYIQIKLVNFFHNPAQMICF